MSKNQNDNDIDINSKDNNNMNGITVATNYTQLPVDKSIEKIVNVHDFSDDCDKAIMTPYTTDRLKTLDPIQLHAMAFEVDEMEARGKLSVQGKLKKDTVLDIPTIGQARNDVRYHITHIIAAQQMMQRQAQSLQHSRQMDKGVAWKDQVDLMNHGYSIQNVAKSDPSQPYMRGGAYNSTPHVTQPSAFTGQKRSRDTSNDKHNSSNSVCNKRNN